MAFIVLPEGIKLLSGPDANKASVIPDVGEPLWVTDTRELRIGDNATPGGVAPQMTTANDVVPRSTGGTFDASVDIDSGAAASRLRLISGTNPNLQLIHDAAGTDLKAAAFVTANGLLAIQRRNDAGGAISSFLVCDMSDGGIYLHGAGGGSTGEGTLNAKGYYVEGVRTGFAFVGQTVVAAGAAAAETNFTLSGVSAFASGVFLQMTVNGGPATVTVQNQPTGTAGVSTRTTFTDGDAQLQFFPRGAQTQFRYVRNSGTGTLTITIIGALI